MISVTLREPGCLELTQAAEVGQLPEGYSRVRVHRIGICGTDWHAYAGRQPFFSYPRILGHELGVEVIECSGLSHVQPGDRCAVEPYLNCGTCIACRRGHSNCCETLQVLGVHVDGGLQEQFILPTNKLHQANDLSYEQLALVETLGIGCHAAQRSLATAEDNVLVVGAGPIGLSILPFLKDKGCRTLVADISAERLDLCGKVSGVEELLNAGEDLEPQLRDRLDGDLPTVILDATGNRASMQNDFTLIAQAGRIVFVGLLQGEIAFDDPNFHKRQVTLISSRNALPADFGRIINMLRTGQIDVRPWITHQGAAPDLPVLLPQWRDGAKPILKAMVSF